MLSNPITESDRVRIARFIQLFLNSPFHRPVQAVLIEAMAYWAQTQPGQADAFWVAPRSMLRGEPDADGMAPWEPIDSPIDEAMAEAFERFLTAPLPPLFKA